MIFEGVNRNKLHGELINVGIIPIVVLAIDETELGAEITFTDDTDIELVQRIVSAHDPTPLQTAQTEIDLLQAENTLLKAQVQANAERADFHEELIAELAMMIIS